MNYYCEGCTARLPIDEIKKARANKEPEYICKFCQTANKLDAASTSHTTKGYELLARGDFYNAGQEFKSAISDCKHHNFGVPAQANLGHALAEYKVQAIYSEQDVDEFPEIICHACNDRYLSDSAEYRNAMSAFYRTGDVAEYEKAKNIAKLVDDVKDFYDAKNNSVEYDVFIAYEDDSEDSAAGLRVATRVVDSLPDGISVFLPESENYRNRTEYEAEILYAINHSKCMLVITDNNIDSRLENIYSRFFVKNRASSGEYGLAFIRYCDRINVLLPSGKNATNIFDEDEHKYIDYVYEILGKIREQKKAGGAQKKVEEIDPSFLVQRPEEGKTHTIINGGRQIWMGSYPQKECRSIAVKRYFEGLGLPSLTESNGWKVMFSTKTGVPYAWYRDEKVDGKKYRGIYFKKYRQLYSVRDYNLSPHNQRSCNYTPGKIYCFSFDPILWNVTNMSLYSAVLVASTGLDSMAFNNEQLDHYWIHSTLREWLNNDFLNSAFDAKEREILFESVNNDTKDTERVFLIDEEFDEKAYMESNTAILGNDYLRCIGGMSRERRSIDSYWVISSNDEIDDDRAKVVHPENAVRSKLSAQPVDKTDVTVIPKIKIKLNEIVEG